MQAQTTADQSAESSETTTRKREPVPAPPGAAWLSDLNLAARYQCHWTAPWRWARDKSRSPRFPKPRKIGPNMTRWNAAEIEAHDRAVLEGDAA